MSEQLSPRTAGLVAAAGDRANTQARVAVFYRDAMVAERQGETVDWPEVNAAIMERWSLSGLERVKTMAWHLPVLGESRDG